MARKKKNKRKIWLLLVLVIFVIAYIAYQESTKPPNTNTTTPQNNSSDNKNEDNQVDKNPADQPNPVEQPKSDNQKPTNNQKDKIPPIPVKETDNLIGELKIEGEVLVVDEKNKTIKIEQIMDDNSVKVSPLVKISSDAIIQNNSGEIKISQIPVGAVVDIILNEKRVARSVTVIE